MNVRTVKQDSNPNKVIAAFIVATDQFLAHQFRKQENLVAKISVSDGSYFSDNQLFASNRL